MRAFLHLYVHLILCMCLSLCKIGYVYICRSRYASSHLDVLVWVFFIILVCICICVCKYVCMWCCLCAYACMFVHYFWLYMPWNIDDNVCVCVCVCVCLCVCVVIWVFFVCICPCLCMFAFVLFVQVYFCVYAIVLVYVFVDFSVIVHNCVRERVCVCARRFENRGITAANANQTFLELCYSALQFIHFVSHCFRSPGDYFEGELKFIVMRILHVHIQGTFSLQFQSVTGWVFMHSYVYVNTNVTNFILSSTSSCLFLTR